MLINRTLITKDILKRYTFFHYFLRNQVSFVLKIILLSIYALCLFFVFLLFVYSALNGLGFSLLFLLPIMIIPLLIVLGSEFFRYYASMKSYANLARMNTAPVEYTFNENSFGMSVQSPGNTGNGEYAYIALQAAYETKQFFYLYIMRNQAYVIDKSSFIQGSADQLRNFLTINLGDKFKRR